MEKQYNNNSENVQQEGETVLFSFRLLSEEEQRIAYAVLSGMQLQKQLDSQHETQERLSDPSISKI